MGKTKVGISLDDELLRRIDAFADENYLNRSSLISLAVGQYLNSADVTKAVCDLALSVRKIADTGVIDDSTREQLEDFERISKMLVGVK